MSNLWVFSKSAVPAVFGLLLTRSVAWYADATVADTPLTAAPAPDAELGRHHFKLLDVQALSTESSTPVSALPDRSFRSVDAVRHGERTYVAIRSVKAGTNSDAVVRVVSSIDDRNWRQELVLPDAESALNPKLLSIGDELILYTTTDPGFGRETNIQAVKLTKSGEWTAPVSLDLPGHVLSQVRLVDGVPLMTTFTGGTGIYRLGDDSLEVRMLTSRDGLAWHPPSAGKWVVYKGGGSDASFASNDDGNLLAVVRKEAGDSQGWGSAVCLAAASNWTNWDCVNDANHYGPAAMFSYDGEVYLIGQRKVSSDGRYDLGQGAGFVRTVHNQLDLLTSGRRCALFRYVAAEKRVAFVADFPSQGDTCTPSILSGSEPGQFVVYTPSSALDGPEHAVAAAQDEPNQLYRYVFQLSRSTTTRSVAY